MSEFADMRRAVAESRNAGEYGPFLWDDFRAVLAELAVRERQLQDAQDNFKRNLRLGTEEAIAQRDQAVQQLTSLREAVQDFIDHTGIWPASGRFQKLRAALAAAGDQQDSQ